MAPRGAIYFGLWRKLRQVVPRAAILLALIAPIGDFRGGTIFSKWVTESYIGAMLRHVIGAKWQQMAPSGANYFFEKLDSLNGVNGVDMLKLVLFEYSILQTF